MSNAQEEAKEILAGLRLPQKKVSPKYFYDERGSQLFDQICELPEYYLTRTEIGIMRQHMHTMAAAIGPRVSVIEFGIGSGLKTGLLLKALHQPVAFIPVDISAEHLAVTTDALAKDFPGIEMLPVAADFTRPFPVPEPGVSAEKNLVYFPGSTIGNFEPDAALGLLKVMRKEAGDNGSLLIGVDLKKDPQLLHKAYNDSQGLTAAFNKNLLIHLNRDFEADFDPGKFKHVAEYDDPAGRVEIRLVSTCKQQIRFAGQPVNFKEGEPIVTEYSHKYSRDEFKSLVSRAGFQFIKSWEDQNDWFSILLFDCV